MSTAATAELVDLSALPHVIDLATANAILGIGRRRGYAMAATGAYPVRVERIGTRYRVITSDLRKFLGVDQPA